MSFFLTHADNRVCDQVEARVGWGRDPPRNGIDLLGAIGILVGYHALSETSVTSWYPRVTASKRDSTLCSLSGGVRGTQGMRNTTAATASARGREASHAPGPMGPWFLGLVARSGRGGASPRMAAREPYRVLLILPPVTDGRAPRGVRRCGRRPRDRRLLALGRRNRASSAPKGIVGSSDLK